MLISQKMKQNKKPISIEERKVVQLEMLKEIDAFCRKNNIKYSLAFGTLLGAVRHKGFIPWDDDVDIMMPLPDMLRFKEIFHSKSMAYCDLDTDKYFQFAFARIANTSTYSQTGLICESYGICIDLYPVVAIPFDIESQTLYFNKACQLEKYCDFLNKWRSRAIRYLPVKSIPFYRGSVRKLSNHLRYSYQYEKSKMFYIIAGPINLHHTMTYNFDMFSKTIEMEFEGILFQVISEYDKFLSLRYGDYMTPPPEDKRHPYHGFQNFWK